MQPMIGRDRLLRNEGDPCRIPSANYSPTTAENDRALDLSWISRRVLGLIHQLLNVLRVAILVFPLFFSPSIGELMQFSESDQTKRISLSAPLESLILWA